MTTKVFCSKCEYCVDVGNIAAHYRCNHPQNAVHKFNAVHEWKDRPECESVNANNDCKLFEKEKTLWQRIFA